MGVTAVLAETNGASGSSTQTLDLSNVNFGSVDSAELVPADNPLTAGADKHSFEKWLRLYVSDMGTSSQLDNVKMWLSDNGSGWELEEGMSTNLITSGYSAKSYPSGGPVETDSPDASVAMPESEPLSANVGIAGSLGGILTTAPNYSDWIVLQLDVGVTTPAGAVQAKTITIQWDEM